ncbi:MAG: nucleotidyltransferase family protein [Defluviitaleaceae bacterium]|nr:nucleotidyltransferase family protein [Defluviitaleaceae bacterium]
MEKICGIIAEYNPFHNGHAFHIQKAKEASGASHVIVAMSGNYVQRGEPALIDKYARTKAALLGGADVVLELPTPYAASSAEYFAAAGVYTLAQTGVVQSICFGAETEDLQLLKDIAARLVSEDEAFKEALKSNLQKGYSFPKARANALCQGEKSEAIREAIATPNNILAIEYLKAIKRYNLDIDAHIVLRKGAGHDDAVASDNFASASFIRNQIFEGNVNAVASFIPNYSFDSLLEAVNMGDINHLDNFTPFFHYALLNEEDLTSFLGVSQAIASRLKKAASKHYEITCILNAAKCKNITMSALRRATLHIVLGTPKKFEALPPQYIRILGFRRDKTHLLAKIQAKAASKVVLNLKDVEGLPPFVKETLEREYKSTQLYNIAKKQSKPRELSVPLVII